ncbi:MAG TPA: hypothetical protein VGM52_09625 [Herbaspirillum sp.]|jgi:hypothetical protein
MFISRRFLVGLGVAGVAVSALFKVCSQRLSQRERLQLKSALNRWENEGGNPTPTIPPTEEK